LGFWHYVGELLSYFYESRQVKEHIKKNNWVQWLMPVISTKIRRITVWGQQREKLARLHLKQQTRHGDMHLWLQLCQWHR
jgi:hypothetical protein